MQQVPILLAAFPVRNAALGASLDAFLKILGGAQPSLLLLLMSGRRHYAIREIAAHGLARGDDGERGTFGNLGRELDDFGTNMILRHANIGETDAGRFLTADATTRVKHQLGLVLAD
jgi:hypothetical protein